MENSFDSLPARVASIEEKINRLLEMTEVNTHQEPDRKMKLRTREYLPDHPGPADGLWMGE